MDGWMIKPHDGYNSHAFSTLCVCQSESSTDATATIQQQINNSRLKELRGVDLCIIVTTTISPRRHCNNTVHKQVNTNQTEATTLAIKCVNCL